MVNRLSLVVGKETLVLETGRMARQANGAIFATYGGTAVIATACCSSDAREGLDFVPLTVEYNEKFYAAGRIPGGFIKRETRPKDREILVSRIIDRPMRPLFDRAFGREIQVVPTVLSYDSVNLPDIVALIAASAAVHISNIPFDGPIAGVRVCLVDGEYCINPTAAEIQKAKLEIVVAGTAGNITMVEGHAEEASEEEMLAAIEAARQPIAAICALIAELGKLQPLEKLPLMPQSVKLENEGEIRAFVQANLTEALFTKDKQLRHQKVSSVIKAAKEKFKDNLTDEAHARCFGSLMEEMQYSILRAGIIEKSLRVDGRNPREIRPINCEVGILPRAHGSALFTRGETQALGVTTLGTVFDEQILDDIEGDRRDRFMLHYNFPPFSVGEVGRMGTGRREIGHGHLARRALEAILPPKEEFPYTVRVVSEVLESNGSSSMATVCAGSLSLMHAGVPLKMPIAGIAMGLITEGDKYAILSDILGDEDHLGDMDFKVAGSERGITGFQMDVKIAGISAKILEEALRQAREGRLHILSIMQKTLSVPSAELSEYAPKVLTTKVEIDKIGAIIGPGGKNIKAMCEKYSVQINVEEDGSVTIYGKSQKNASEAKAALLKCIEDPEVGKIYEGTVKRIMDFGAFIEILPGREGLCHISRLSNTRVENVSDVVHDGDKIRVKLMEIDRMGRLNLAAESSLGSGEPSGDEHPRSDSRPQGESRGHGHPARRFDNQRPNRSEPPRRN